MNAATLADALAAAGINLPKGKTRGPCPHCNHGPKDEALHVTFNGDGSAVWFCHRCNRADGWRPRDRLPDRSGKSRPTPPPPLPAGLSPKAAAFWSACAPITADGIAARYLTGRRCALPHPDGDLRFHPSALHWPTRTRWPALVGLITDAVTNEPRSLHFTFLARDGDGKAPLGKKARLYLPDHRKQGGVVRLWPDAEVTIGLAIAEGVENALSGARAFPLAWAALDAGNVAAFPVLSGIESLTIFADHDAAGIAAAEACAARWTQAGREVRIWRAAIAGADINRWVAA
jgi:hypothetical protein